MANLAHTVQGSLASSISSVRKQNNNYMIMRLPRQFYRSLKIAYFCLKNFLFLPILKKNTLGGSFNTKCRAVWPLAFRLQANMTTITGLWVCSTRPNSSLKKYQSRFAVRNSKKKFLTNYWFVEYGTSEDSEWYKIDPGWSGESFIALKMFRHPYFH